MNKIFASIAILATTVLSCTSNQKNESNADYQDRNPAAYSKSRGNLAEYDQGPPKSSKWPDLFAETPNYRAYGKAIYQYAAKKYKITDDQSEKFRWKVGPMWYRGRLTPNSVKVFIIGQEGAQDENTSNRTFTGSTGTKMQNFINYFGIDRSYLFMNTFSYTITGQYGEKYKPDPDPKIEAAKPKELVERLKREADIRSRVLYWIAQDPESIVVQHRHRMFDYMLSQNRDSLRLIIGVGSAGKDSLATWIRSHGGKCSLAQLSSSYCNADVIRQGAIAIGVMHPGAASQRNGGAEAANSLQAQFARRAQVVAEHMKKNPSWLQPDPGMRTNFSREYFYADAPIPHRDFAFGTTWRLGNDGTATNRRGADGIQIYSDNGCYNNVAKIDGKCDRAEKPKTLNVKYDIPADIPFLTKKNKEDVPWESPKNLQGRRDYDLGPGQFAPLLMGLDKYQWPAFTSIDSNSENRELMVVSHPSFGHGPIYRGNLENAEVLVLADQESQDDMFSTRALTGTGGQRLQTYLSLMKLDNNYAIIRTLPVDTLEMPLEKVKSIALNREVEDVRNHILAGILSLNKTKLVLTVGEVAKEAIRSIKTGTPVVHLDSALNESHIFQWQKAQKEIEKLGIGYSFTRKYRGDLTAVPRGDLPAHTRVWMGTSGSRAQRSYLIEGGKKIWNGDYYQFNAPDWVSSRNYPALPTELNRAEEQSVNSFKRANILDDATGEVFAEKNNDFAKDESEEKK